MTLSRGDLDALIRTASKNADARLGKANGNGSTESNSITAKSIKAMKFEPIKFVVPGAIVEGLTLLAAKPKVGKSWLMLHVAIAVARGGFTLGDITNRSISKCTVRRHI